MHINHFVTVAPYASNGEYTRGGVGWGGRGRASGEGNICTYDVLFVYSRIHSVSGAVMRN